MEDFRTKVLLGAVIVLILISVMATYYKMVEQRDFVIIDDLDEVELGEE